MDQHTLGQTTRTSQSLNGTWHFEFWGHKSAPIGEARQIQVPGTWQAAFPDLAMTTGRGVYRREITIPQSAQDNQVFLLFGGIYYKSEVYVDGKLVALHNNSWIPLELDMSAHVKAGSTHTLEVHSILPLDEGRFDRAEGLGSSLLGKQQWYGFQGGIWQDVTLEVRGAQQITLLDATTQTDLTTHSVSAQIECTGLRAGTQLDISVETLFGDVLSQSTQPAEAQMHITLPVAEVAFWSPDTPTCYRLRTQLIDATGTLLEDLTRTIGFRKIEEKDGHLYLNGKRFLMRGALDQDYYPLTDTLPREDGFLRERFMQAKAIGLNTLRCHVKVPHPEYLELANELGLLVWLDMPYTQRFTANAREQLLETFNAAVTRYRHHPSILIWTLINEGWGLELKEMPEDRQWLIEQYDELKPKLAGALFVDNSACGNTYHMKSDIDDYHWYHAWPEEKAEWEQITTEFTDRADWSYSPFADAKRSYKEPLIVSEFGTWGLPHLPEMRKHSGQDPWWFQSGYDRAKCAAIASGMDLRFNAYGLNNWFDSVSAFVDSAQRKQYQALKYQIESMRQRDGLSGYVITELTDAHWEANGIMDLENNPRNFAGQLASINQDTMLIPRLSYPVALAGGKLDVQVELSSVVADLPEATLEFSVFGQNYKATFSNMKAGVTFSIPAEQNVGSHTVQLVAVDPKGTELARTDMVVHVARPSDEITDWPNLYALDETARETLSRFGLPQASSANEAEVLLATKYTPDLEEKLRHGQRVLLIANDELALQDKPWNMNDIVRYPSCNIKNRKGSAWTGSWIGMFTWRSQSGKWANIPGDIFLDDAFEDLHPKQVIGGMPINDFHGMIDSGAVLGWAHHPVAFVRHVILGKGWMTVTTFDLTSQTTHRNPAAPFLLRAVLS